MTISAGCRTRSASPGARSAIIRQNIAVSLIVKAIFLALTFAGVTNLWLAVLADMGTSLLVTANALRVLRTSPADSRDGE